MTPSQIRIRKCRFHWHGRSLLVLASVLLVLNLIAVETVAAANQKIYVFRGKVQKFDPAAQTLTLRSGSKAYVFKVTPETKLIDNGRERKFTGAWAGLSAEVTMKIGAGGEGVALAVKPVSTAGALILSVMAGTTPGGKILSAEEVKPLILYEHWASGMPSGYRQLTLGVFLLAVRGDGAISKVEILQSTSDGALDDRIMAAFLKWRFRPNSLKEVRMPAYYIWRRG